MNAQTAFTKLIARLILILALAILCLGSLPKPSQAAPTDTTFIVDSTEDYFDAFPDGECKTNEVCTLREAIQESNAIPSGNKYIYFDASLSGEKIAPSGASNGLIISGDHITIDGSGVSDNVVISSENLYWVNTFDITGDYNTIYDLTLAGTPYEYEPGPESGHAVHIYNDANYNTLDQLIIYGFKHDGIMISGDYLDLTPGTHNTVTNCLIGNNDWNATSCDSNNEEEGIEVLNSAAYTTISNNYIVCNKKSGIYLNSGTSPQIDNTLIQSNHIGNNGYDKLGNILAGIADTQSRDTTINGNLISGNGNQGIWLNGTEDAIVTGNHIGVDQSLTSALANGSSGVVLTYNARSNNIGGDTNTSERNIISGNGGCGVEFNNGAYDNIVLGNYIGLGGSDGMTVVPNWLGGVCLFDSGTGINRNSIGVSGTVQQYISGNTREGVYVSNSSVSIGDDTYIGVKGDSTTPAGNGWEGVYLDEGSISSEIAAARVMYNGWAGIVVIGDTSTGNQLRPGRVAYNGGLGIDLNADGHTPNYSHTPPGPNSWIHYPVFYSYSGSGFTGNTCAGCFVQIYQVIGNPIASGGGGVYKTVVASDPATGNFYANFPSGVLAITMQTFDNLTGNTSELSPTVMNPNSHKTFVPFIIR